MIPAFLSIDVEPDGFQLSRSAPPTWAGYEAMFEFAESLRSKLTERLRKAPKFGWYFRTDPQIAEVYGRPDYPLTEFRDRTARLQGKGDYFGVHSHPIRWHDEQRQWIHDFGDAAWNTHRIKFSLDAYAQWSGTAAQRFRGGAGFLTNEIVDAIDQCGVKVDLTLEPVTAWPATSSKVPSGVDTSSFAGVQTNCRSAPRTAYRPSRHDFRVPDVKNGRDLIMIPLATYLPTGWRPLLRRVRQCLLLKPPQREVRVLHPSVYWPSSTLYWDLVTQQILSMPRPYLSLAVRTDAPSSAPAMRVRTLFEALLQHPVLERLHFVDPLDVGPRLV